MRKDILPVLVVFLISYLVLYTFLGSNIFNPNNFVYAFGGDAGFIYYNMIFHANYGSGWTLTNVNYPFFESLLMTDSQASISYLLQLIKGDWIKTHVVGLSHTLHYFLLALASIYGYLGLRKMKVSVWMSILFGILIVFMSPQIIRLRFGHFGLAYPFIFTYVFYQLLSLSDKSHWVKYAILSIIILLFGINNIYLLVLASGWILVYGLLSWIINGRSRNILGLIIASIVPIIITYLLLYISAAETDRLEIQWGYYANRARIEHMIYPFTSLLGTWLGYPKDYVESANNLGLVSNVALLVGVYLLWKKKFRTLDLHNNLGLIALSSFALFIYATGIFRFAEEWISMSTMFKASGRFAWPLYFVIAYATVYGLHCLMLKKSIWSKVIVGIAIVLWSYECYNYLEHHVMFKQYKNEFSEKIQEGIRDKMQESQIQIEDYQAIFSLPMVVAWNDKFNTRGDWFTEFSSIKVSLATGLPMINGCISRLGVSDGMRMINFGSHPWIQKSMTLPNRKDVLLVVGKNEANLTEGEQFLKERASFLMKDQYFSLYKLRLEDLVYSDYDRYLKHLSTSDLYLHEGFEQGLSQSFFGNGAVTVDEDSSLVGVRLKDWPRGDYNASLYFFMDAKKHGAPNIVVRQFSQGKAIKKDKMRGSNSRNADGNWRRLDLDFTLKEQTDSIELSVTGINQPFIIDELLVRAVSDTIIISNNEAENGYLINNYLLRK